MADSVQAKFSLPLAILKDDIELLRRYENPEARKEKLDILILTIEEAPRPSPEKIVSQFLDRLKDPEPKNDFLALKVVLITLDKFPDHFSWEKRLTVAETISDHVKKNPALIPYLYEIILKTSPIHWTTIPEMAILILVQKGERSTEFLQTLRSAQERSGPEREKLIGMLLKDLERQGQYLGLGSVDAYSFGDGGYAQLGAQAWYGHRWNRKFEWRTEASLSWLSTAPETKKDYQLRLATGPILHWPNSIGDGKIDPYVSAQAGFFHTAPEVQNGLALITGFGLQYFFSDRWLLDGAIKLAFDMPFSGKLNFGIQAPMTLVYRFF